MKFSIIVPVYNALSNLSGLIKCFENQNFYDCEIIFVDNNSTDGSFEYLSKIQDPRIKVFKEVKQGPSFARKLGLEKSNGDYIWFIDADDKIFDNSLDEISKIIDDKNADVIIGNYIENNIQLNTSSIKKGVFFSCSLNNLSEYKNLILIKPSLCNKVFKKELLCLDAFIDSRIGEDMIVTVIALMNAKNPYYLNKKIYEYSFSSEGLTSSINQNDMEGIVKSCSSLLKISCDRELYETYRDELNYLVFTHILYRMLRTVLIEDKVIRNECYNYLHNFLLEIPYTNSSYYKKAIHYKIGNFIIMNKNLFFSKIITFLLRQLFLNKTLNKLFKLLDK